MRKIIFSILVLFAAVSCKESEIVKYSEAKDGVYFSETRLLRNYNFADSSLGDSLKTDTLSVILGVLGRASEQDRNVFFILQSYNKLDSSGYTYLEYPQPFVFRANLLSDTMKVVMHHPQKRQTSYGIGLKIDASNAGHSFSTGVKESLVYNFIVRDTYAKPGAWDYGMPWYGEYSTEKHAFIVTILKQRNFYDDWMKGSQNVKLRRALEKYNSENPDNPKPFTFPVKTSDW